MHTINHQIFNITSVHLRVLEPTQAVTPFQDATMGPFPAFGLAMLTLEDENGFAGEAPVYGSYINILESCLLPILLHSHNVPYHQLYPQLYWSIRNEGFRGPASALVGQIDLALHDLAARREGVPLHRFLHADRDTVKMYGSGGGTNYTLQELEKEVSLFMEAGVDCYKMKVGKAFGTMMKEDAERVKFVRSLLGRDVRLAVDANQIWNCGEALRFAEMVAAEEVAWFEEPIHSASFEQIGLLCNHTPLKISFGESERTSRLFPTLVKMGVQHLQPVPNHLAGVNEWKEVRDLAAKAGVDFSSGGYSLFTASLMATADPACEVEYLYSIMSGLECYFSIYPEWKNGYFLLPDVAGLPVRVDWDYCKRENKITKQHYWSDQNVRKYSPTVSL
ncbi:MAG TPA: enolase C-terminal domain-like protein [Chitinophaga sp.]|uniref:enolase C-terminal domain-like protein n=1 Tax=Chitinophaga sp. TaxID=1869181 RepID=UPI002B95BB15|nr:enolase C-terminal domain-like protein [Chitinophaga sp.]HVI44264.1 enolase C-terminal domain-like protein [Chitinophaga sp.]